MAKETGEIDWDVIMQKYSSYEGVITDFCRENMIRPHQLYYRRKKLKTETKSAFYAISLNKEDNIKLANINPYVQEAKDIRIELGKANIYIPINEITVLSDIIKELSKSC